MSCDVGVRAVCKSTPRRDDNGDSSDLRCYDQKRRFGFDMLYPTARYVQAVSQRTFTCAGSDIFGRIVGVPWQDTADDASLHGAGLTYLRAQELLSKGRWSVLLGDSEASPPPPPGDPFMVESITPRAGTNLITGDAIMPPTSMSPSASPINGHEQKIPISNGLLLRRRPQLAVAEELSGYKEAQASAREHGRRTDSDPRSRDVRRVSGRAACHFSVERGELNAVVKCR